MLVFLGIFYRFYNRLLWPDPRSQHQLSSSDYGIADCNMFPGAKHADSPKGHDLLKLRRQLKGGLILDADLALMWVIIACQFTERLYYSLCHISDIKIANGVELNRTATEKPGTIFDCNYKICYRMKIAYILL